MAEPTLIRVRGSGALHSRGAQIGVDHDGDGVIASRDRLAWREVTESPMTIGGKAYDVEVAPDGSVVRLTRTDRPIPGDFNGEASPRSSRSSISMARCIAEKNWRGGEAC